MMSFAEKKQNDEVIYVLKIYKKLMNNILKFLMCHPLFLIP